MPGPDSSSLSEGTAGGASAPSAQADILAAQLADLLGRPEFVEAIVDVLRSSPAFASLFAEKLGWAMRVPGFAEMVAGAIARSQAAAVAIAGPDATPPFAPLFADDLSVQPPATYTPASAARMWSGVFDTALQFLFANRMQGDIYEFGTLHGYTARHLAVALAARGVAGGPVLRLFDTFSGFPELKSAIDRTSYTYADMHWVRGGCAAQGGAPDRIARMLRTFLPAERFAINVGTFEDTLTRSAAPNPALLVHMDCDLYESAKLVLDRLVALDALQDGTVIVWDDFNCGRASPEFGERRALHETFADHPRFTCEPWFAYGWHGQVSLVHERGVARRRGTG
jgi:hypothetical protein